MKTVPVVRLAAPGWPPAGTPRAAELVGEHVAEDAKPMSRSTVSRQFVKQTETALAG